MSNCALQVVQRGRNSAFHPAGLPLAVAWCRLRTFLGIALTLPLVVSVCRGQPDYSPAHWVPPACVKYYTSGYGHSFCVIHDMEGYYLDSISYLNRCDTDSNGVYNVDASVYYLVNGLQNGTDNLGHAEHHPNDPVAGDITQSVRESDYAWHVVCWNKYMFGTEHEGFVTTPAWYSEAMYQASAGLQRHLCLTYSIPIDRNHIIGHDEWQNAAWTNWMAANWPQIDTTCNNHTDPGPYWNWSHFISLILGTNNPGGPYWDPNGPTPGAGSAPSGVWDTTTTNWTGDPNGGVNTGRWPGTTAIFSAGTDATGAYAITVSGTQTVNNLYVQLGTVTFNGGQLNFTGTGAYFSNYVAAGATAIFNTPFGGTGSPDKWGPGTAVYRAASTSGGYFTLNQGTLALGNDAALGTLPLHLGEPTGENFVTVQSADATPHTVPGYLLVYAFSFSFGAGGNLTFTGDVNLGANNIPAKTMAVSNSITILSGVVSNTAGFTKNGPGTLVLGGTNANTYGSTSANGNTTINAGMLLLNKLPGVAAVANGTLILKPGGILALGASDQVANTVPMTLAGGTFQTAGFNEQLDTLALTANSLLDLGPGSTVLQFANSSGVSWTAAAILTITNWHGSFSGGGSQRVLFGNTGSALTAGQLSQIRFANPAGLPAGSYPATLLGTGEVVAETPAPVIAIGPSGNAQLQVSLTGIPGYRYALLGSTNLLDWSPFQTNNSPFIFIDTNTATSPQRFYRGEYLP